MTKELGSDVCFVTTSLWEIFLRGMDQLPPTNEPMEIKFLRQNVQINMGCQIFYAPQKARRIPGSEFPKIEINKNHFFPLLLDEWKTLSAAQKLFWRQRLKEAGVIPRARQKGSRRRAPYVSTGRRKRKSKKILGRWKQSMTNVTGWLWTKLKGFKL